MNAKTQRGLKLSRAANRGVSLIEVLVAIAILAIGMLAVLLLFPAGLVAINTAANSTMADRLGQAELEKISGSVVQSVAGVYSNDGVTANENPETFLQSAAYEISSASGYVPNPSTNLSMNNGTDVDAFRTIDGETIRIPSPNSQGLSLYTVIADPIESGTLQVNGLPWQSTSGNSDSTSGDYLDVGSAASPGQPQYLIDYAAGKICLAQEATGSTPYAQNIIFTITDATGLTIIQHLTVTAAPMQSGVWVKLSDLVTTDTAGNPTLTAGQEGQLPWSSGSDVLVRNFTMVPPPTNGSTGLTWASNDPFQYQMYLPDYGPTTSTASAPDANLGVIAFNPVASTMHSANGLPLEAVLNYRAYDWHIISEDRLVTSATSTARLSLVNLLANTASDKLSDNNTVFSGLFTYSGTSTGTLGDPDFIVLDMDTGYVLKPVTDYTVNYPDGSLSFNNATTPEYVNDHLRIFYHPANDWAVALARAPLVYKLDPTPANPTPALSSYSVNGTVINFPLVDIGKQVDIRFTYTNGTATQSAEDLYTIVSTGGTGAGVNLASTSLDTTIPSSATNVTPTAVKGVSVSAIVIWKENNIWHNRTLTTVLTPPSQLSQTNLQ